MNIKVTFKREDDQGVEKTLSKTFSNVNEDASDQEMISFIKAYMSLTDIEDYQVQKITSQDLA